MHRTIKPAGLELLVTTGAGEPLPTIAYTMRSGGVARLHRAPIPEEEPLPGEEPAPEDDPVPHPDPVVREPENAPSVHLSRVSRDHSRIVIR